MSIENGTSFTEGFKAKGATPTDKTQRPSKGGGFIKGGGGKGDKGKKGYKKGDM